MQISKKIKIAVAAFSCGILASGCANMMYERTSVSEKSCDEILESNSLCHFSQDPGANSFFIVNLEKKEKVKVVKYQYHDRTVYYTKYIGWHELYEMPAGMLLLPVSLGSHLLSAISFNMFPFSTSARINDMAFSGINPFMNWEADQAKIEEEESKTRSGEMKEEDRVTSYEHILDPNPTVLGNDTIDRTVPLVNAAVQLRSGSLVREFRTDALGTFPVYYISLSDPRSDFTPQKRKLEILIPGVKDMNIRGNSVVLKRSFITNLNLAKEIVASYLRMKRVEFSAARLYKDVIKLEKMGFIDLAYELEEFGLKDQTENFVRDYYGFAD